jgi:hypothetical protein
MRRWNLRELLAVRLLTQTADTAPASEPTLLPSTPPAPRAVEMIFWRFDGDSVATSLSPETWEAVSQLRSPTASAKPQKISPTATGVAPSDQ